MSAGVGAGDRRGEAPAALVRDISDTATWAAHYRAIESARPDALFRDPQAARLAGERGARIAAAESDPQAWAWTMRTLLFDELLRAELASGTDLVVNLAAGLDARPYRMELPAALRWVEVDLPAPLDYKEAILAGEAPRCRLERVRADLADATARRQLFVRLAGESRRAVVLTEGLLIYLDAADVGALAADLAAVPAIQGWLLDLQSPGLVEMVRKQMGEKVAAGGAAFRFGPAEGPAFFNRYGWRPLAVRSLFKTAARFRRLPFPLRLLAWLPESQGKQGKKPWSAVVLLGRG